MPLMSFTGITEFLKLPASHEAFERFWLSTA